LGYGGKAEVSLRDARITPKQPRIGESVTVSFTLVNQSPSVQRVMADLVVHFVKARGTGAKTFKLKALELAPRASVALSKKIALKQLTTRQHYPGSPIEALLNGRRNSIVFAAPLSGGSAPGGQRPQQPAASATPSLIERA
jgi:hypothetical protein